MLIAGHTDHLFNANLYQWDTLDYTNDVMNHQKSKISMKFPTSIFKGARIRCQVNATVIGPMSSSLL